MSDANAFPTLEAAGWFVRTKITDADPHGFIIADCKFRTDGNRFAQLFAAAPDLLESLQKLVDIAAPNIYPQPDKPSAAWSVLQEARASIDKATGAA